MNAPWKAKQILDMQGERSRFAHVVKHFYSKKERWQQVTLHHGDPRSLAKKAGCINRELRHYDLVTPDCREHVLGDHDQAYAPAYREALSQAEHEDRVGKEEDERNQSKHAWIFVGDNGVSVIVREVRRPHGKPKRPEVKSAYRVWPRKSQGQTPEDFFKAAVRKLRDKTSYEGDV